LLEALRRAAGLTITVVMLGATAFAGQRPWIEVRSPHFRVLTDGSAGDARRVAREFEQMRAVFAVGFPGMRLETGAPLLVFAPRDEASMKSLAPAQWKVKGAPKVAGFFLHGWDRQFAVIRVDQDVPGAYQVVYHEYVHTLLHANFRWLPTWLDEGLADYYGGTRFEKTKIYIGAPSMRVYAVQGEPLIPIEKLISENPYTAFKGDDQRIDLFYSESWALIHYFIFGPNMERGKKLTGFFRKLQMGEEQKKAFTETFGSFQSVQSALEAYVRKFAFESFVMTNPEQISEKEFAERKLSVAETEAAIGSFRLWSHDPVEAREIVEQGLKDDPKLGELHEDMGLLDFTEGKDQDAATEFATANGLDNQRFLSRYFQTMMAPTALGNTPADEADLQEGLRQTLKINPEFAPAFVQLAFLVVRQGDLNTALAVSRKAEELEPTRAGYHLLSGRILLRLGKGAEAAEYAKFVAERWRGPDHNEAIELWKNVPESERPPGPALDLELSAPQSAEGKIADIRCGDKDHPMVVTLRRQADSLKFRAAGGFMVGFSDKVWYGSDHSSLCHHTDGMRAQVWYKPSTTKEYNGDLTSIELRVDLPASPEKNGPDAQQPAAPNKN